MIRRSANIMYVVQERRTTHFEASKLWKGSSGNKHLESWTNTSQFSKLQNPEMDKLYLVRKRWILSLYTCDVFHLEASRIDFDIAAKKKHISRDNLHLLNSRMQAAAESFWPARHQTKRLTILQAQNKSIDTFLQHIICCLSLWNCEMFGQEQLFEENTSLIRIRELRLRSRRLDCLWKRIRACNHPAKRALD